jgi:hypothetical protein
MVWAGFCHDGRTQLKIVQATGRLARSPDSRSLLRTVIC